MSNPEDVQSPHAAYDRVLEVRLSRGAIENGYIHFPLEKSIFAEEHYGDKSGAQKGVALTVTDPYGRAYEDDVRVVGNTGRLRSRFGALFRQAGAAEGDLARIVQTGVRSYRLEIVRSPRDERTSSVQGEPLTSEPRAEQRSIMQPTNLILYGPPGTGKTFATSRRAVLLCDGALPASGSEEEIHRRFAELKRDNRITFITFHPSYGYEEFVEGLRPHIENKQPVYSVRPGVFVAACAAARIGTHGGTRSGAELRDRTFYKMSLGATWNEEGTTVFEYCVENNCILLGWGDDVDFSGCDTREAVAARVGENASFDRPDSQTSFVHQFKNQMAMGDIVLVSHGNTRMRAIAEVTGDYEFVEDAPFHQMRRVRWLALFPSGKPATDFYTREIVQRALYEMKPAHIRFEEIQRLLDEQGAPDAPSPHVVIIDEINRANISKVFGELITLLEADKREGMPHAATAKLPYSGDEFSIPANLHVIGTMNTADRSIALLDTALRRRFDFEEVMPDPLVLGDKEIEGVHLGKMLGAMNDRIEALYDRDHTIGHAYLIAVDSLADLESVFRRRIIPLLQEYFFEDWEKVRKVLNDRGVGDFILRKAPPQISSPMDDDDLELDELSPRWSPRPAQSPIPASAFIRIYSA